MNPSPPARLPLGRLPDCDMNMELTEVDIDQVVPGPVVRREMGDLDALANSVRRLGLLFPVLINRRGILISGSRRVAACRAAGITRVPALIVDVDETDIAAVDIQCQENVCRKDLTMAELQDEIDRKKAFLRRTSVAGPGSLFSQLKSWFTTTFKGAAG